MKFSRALVGYAPAQVDEEIYQRLSKYSIEKKQLMEQFHEAVREHDQLVSQRDSLRANLEYVRVSSSFVGNYEKHLGPSMLSKVQDSAHSRVQRILEEKASQISLIEETIALLDHQISIIKEELLAIARTVEMAALSVDLHDSLYAQIETVDAAIRGYFEGSVKREGSSPLHADIATDVLPMLMTDPAIQQMVKPSEDAAARTSSLDPASRAAAQSYLNKLKEEFPHKSQQVIAATKEEQLAPVVVIAENDRDTAMLMCNILEKEGFDTSMVADGYALSHMIKEMAPPAVVIVDSQISYINIVQIIGEIRHSPTWSDVPILALTPEHDKPTIISVLDAGANDSLEKPFNPRELAARVRRLSMIRS